MEAITQIGPSKLDLLLAEAPELSDESKTKVILLIDINRLGVLLSGKPMPPKAFYQAYDAPVEYLEKVQHDLQIEWNSVQYNNRMFGGL